MSKQDSAKAHWEECRHMAVIEKLMKQAIDYAHPAGQAQAGLQFAYVEVPWLLEEITRLKEQINGRQSLESTQPARKAAGL